ncbi:MAG: hypothetical protein ACRD0S_01990, partial [Acidimicrobiales bacterium]
PLPEDVWAPSRAGHGLAPDRGLAGSGPARAAGVVFMAVGLSLLLAGFLAAMVTRRRRAVHGAGPSVS